MQGKVKNGSYIKAVVIRTGRSLAKIILCFLKWICFELFEQNLPKNYRLPPNGFSRICLSRSEFTFHAKRPSRRGSKSIPEPLKSQSKNDIKNSLIC